MQKLSADTWWHETLHLYAAQMDATMLVNAFLHLNTDAALNFSEKMKINDLLGMMAGDYQQSRN